MQVKLRPAEASDLKSAAELIRNQRLFEPYGLTPAALERTLLAAHGRGEQLHVADLNGTVSGLIWFQLQGAFGRSGYVRLLVTGEQAQGQGIGARLLALAEQTVFAQTGDMFLLVNSFNADARRFYERHGYAATGTIPDYVAPGLDEVIMHKKRPF